MEITFKTKNDKQIEAAEAWLDNEVEEILYGGGKGGGKSFLGVSLIFADALTYPDTHYFIARKELNDLRKFTIPTVYEVFSKWQIKLEDYAKYNGQDNFFQLTNGSRVYLIACKQEPSDPLFERFGSMQMTRGMIEEGGEILEAAKSNLWLSIGRWKNQDYKLKKKLLITANPKKGWMKKDFVDMHNAGTLPKSRKFIKALAVDNKYLSEDYINTLRNEKDEVRRQRLFLGDWDYDESKDSIISYEALMDMFTNTVILDNKKYLSVDVARFGKDSTTIYFYKGSELYRIEQRQKQSITETAKQIKNILITENIPYSQCIIDEDGVGGGLVDSLFGVVGFIANSSPLPTAAEIRQKQGQIINSFVGKANYRNLKAQCGYKLAEMINEHKISVTISDDTIKDLIVSDLSAILKVKEVDSDGKLQLKSKELVKQEIGRSPDFGDPMLMRMWFELQKEAIGADPNLEKTINLQRNKMMSNTREIKSTK